MIPTSDLNMGDLRLLEVDNRLIVPIETPVRVLVTAADVIHALAVPSLGVKVDVVPGRLNQTRFCLLEAAANFRDTWTLIISDIAIQSCDICSVHDNWNWMVALF